MLIVNNTIKTTRAQVQEWKKQGYKVGFVPTMGALHVGHMSLVKKAKQDCDKVVVSIFVNPTQFGPNEDFDCYPRTLESDEKLCIENGVDMIFAPSVGEMYPDFSKEVSGDKNELLTNHFITYIKPPESYVDKLCGKARPGHFDGVATVVVKLFNIIQPDYAFFGQKDAQQVAVIKKFTRDLNIPVEIIRCPIQRQIDGLAYSSRNKYLTDQAKMKAASIYKMLEQVQYLFKSGNNNLEEVISMAKGELAFSVELEYIDCYDADNLEKTSILKKNTLVAVAAKVDNVRLIDNIII